MEKPCRQARVPRQSATPSLHELRGASDFSFAPITASQSMVATSANKTGWAKVQTLSAYAGYSKPDKLTAKYAKQASISQTPRMRGRKVDLNTKNPNGKNHQAPPK